MYFSQTNSIHICITLNAHITIFDNFKYFGSWMNSYLKDFEFRKALSRRACHNIKKLCNSNIAKTLKIIIVKVTKETILFYGSETWTINKSLEKIINACYTKLLRMVLNVSWKDNWSNKKLYNDMPKSTNIIATRRLSIAGHCIRHNEEATHNLIFWEPKRKRKYGV